MLRTLASKTVSTTPNAYMNIMSIVESGQDLNFGLGTKVNNQNASYIFFITKIINRTFIMYRIVASRSTSRLVTCLGLFRLLMKEIFGPYVLWPLDKKLIFWIVTRASARDYTVSVWEIWALEFLVSHSWDTRGGLARPPPRMGQ